MLWLRRGLWNGIPGRLSRVRLFWQAVCLEGTKGEL